jgi:transposase
MKSQPEFAAWIGLDWADRSHFVCLCPSGQLIPEQLVLPQQPDAIHGWVAQLRIRFGGRPVALALEQSRGPLLYALMQYDFLVLFPVNPQALASYRKAFRLSGAKDDPSDAQLLLDFLRTHYRHLKAWNPDDVTTRKLRLLVQQRRKLVDEHTRMVNRLTSLLKEYFPQVLNWFGSIAQPGALKFLSHYSSLQQAQRARKASLQKYFRRQPQQRLQQIRQALALTEDRAVLAVHPRIVSILVLQLQDLQKGIAQLQAEIEDCLNIHPDTFIFASFPGSGAVQTPRLLAAYGTDRDRFETYSMRCFSGIAPVTERSGKSTWTHHRLICPKFLKQTFHEFARCSIPHCGWANAFYHRQRLRGASQHQAIRALAFKWIAILTRCWKQRIPYDEHTYLQALRRRNSPLIAFMEQRTP